MKTYNAMVSVTILANSDEEAKHIARDAATAVNGDYHFVLGDSPTPPDTSKNDTVWRVSEDDIKMYLSEKYPNLTTEQVEELIDMAHNDFSIPDHVEYIEVWVDQNIGDVMSYMEVIIRQQIEEMYPALAEKYIQELVELAETRFTAENMMDIGIHAWVDKAVEHVKANAVLNKEIEKE